MSAQIIAGSAERRLRIGYRPEPWGSARIVSTAKLSGVH